LLQEEKGKNQFIALEDIKVLDLTQYVAGPYSTKLLADYGAQVIKIEEPGFGDPSRSMGPFPGDIPHPEKSGLFLYLNMNKKGITLNLKSEAGKRVFRQLIAGIDILVESYRPGMLSSLELDYDNLKKINQNLVLASITNFGLTGPYSDFKAGDITIWAMGGEMYSTGVPGREPLMLAPNVAQYIVGSVAAVGIMGAFYAARYLNIGQQVDVSAMEVQSGVTERRLINLLSYEYRGKINPRIATMEVGFPYGVYPCKDGYINVQGGRVYWDRIVKMVESPAFLMDPKWTKLDAQANPSLKAEFEKYFLNWLINRTKKETIEAGQAAGVPCTPLQTTEEVFKDPHFNARGCFVEIEHPMTGVLKYPRSPVLLNGTPAQIKRPAPMLGQHNCEIFGQLGFSNSDLVKLRQQGVI